MWLKKKKKVQFNLENEIIDNTTSDNDNEESNVDSNESGFQGINSVIPLGI